jgi:hypothetical protein
VTASARRPASVIVNQIRPPGRWTCWPAARTGADFGKLVAEETEKWGKVIKFAGIKAD